MENKNKLTYKDSGVNYERMDLLKLKAQKAAKKTEDNILDTSFRFEAWSRGESAAVYSTKSKQTSIALSVIGEEIEKIIPSIKQEQMDKLLGLFTTILYYINEK